MNCPRCGAAIEEGKAYCADPACGAVPGGQRGTVVADKTLRVAFRLDFVLLARLAAVLIAAIAAALLYFSRIK